MRLWTHVLQVSKCLRSLVTLQTIRIITFTWRRITSWFVIRIWMLILSINKIWINSLSFHLVNFLFLKRHFLILKRRSWCKFLKWAHIRSRLLLEAMIIMIKLIIIELILIINLVSINKSIIISNNRASGKNKFFTIEVCILNYSISLGHLATLVIRSGLLKVWISVLFSFSKSIWLQLKIRMNYWFTISSNMVLLCFFWRIIFINFFQIQNRVIIFLNSTLWIRWIINLWTTESSFTWCSYNWRIVFWWWLIFSLVIQYNLWIKLWIILMTSWRCTQIIKLLVQIPSNIWERWWILFRSLELMVWDFTDWVVHSWW